MFNHNRFTLTTFLKGGLFQVVTDAELKQYPLESQSRFIGRIIEVKLFGIKI